MVQIPFKCVFNLLQLIHEWIERLMLQDTNGECEKKLCVSNEGPLKQRHVFVLELEVESMSLGGGFFDFKTQPNM